MTKNEVYIAEIKIKGTSSIIFHAWSTDAIEKQKAAKKGSKEKTEADLESMVYRNKEGEICIPGDYFKAALVDTAKFKQDPRSPRKSAKDLYRSGMLNETLLAPIGPSSKTEWDYVDKRRMIVQKAAVTRHRPAFNEGWEATFRLKIILPQYIGIEDLQELAEMAGNINGLADSRPTHGRFEVIYCNKI